MTRSVLTSCLVFSALVAVTPGAHAQAAPNCDFKEDELQSLTSVNLIAVLQNAPRTKVTLSIDSKSGFHREIVWDPAAGDALKHDLLLPRDEYTVRAYAEEDRVQTGTMVMTKTTQFKSCRDDEIPIHAFKNLQMKLDAELHLPLLPDIRQKELNAWNRQLENRLRLLKSSTKRNADKHAGCLDYAAGEGLLVSTQRTIVFTSSMGTDANAKKPDGPIIHDETANAWRPKIRLICEKQGALELSNVPLAKKQLYAASVARGFLDQAAPTVVTDTLAILAEIALDRAKTSAMALVKDRFVTPMCKKLDLELLGLGDEGEMAFPRTCALLENMRLQDLLSAGRNLIEAARDDIRLTLVPRIVARLDLPSAAQDIAVLALDLGNKLIDGGGSDVAEIDLLFTQLDRMFRRGTVGSFAIVNSQFVRETFALVRAELGAPAYNRLKEQFLREVFQRVLPQDPGEWLSSHVRKTAAETALATALHLDQVEECARQKDTDTSFIAADRKDCINKLIEHFRGLPEWGKTDDLFASIYGVLPAEQLVSMVSAIGSNTLKDFHQFSEWLEIYAASATRIAGLATTAGPALLQRNCAVRVTIAVVKWCSGRDNCTASDIAAAIDRPETLFGPSTSNAVENLCWNIPAAGSADLRTLRLPTIRTPYVELATRALAFLTPPPKGEERKRVQAMLRWTFDLAKTLDENRATSLQKLEEILELFEKRDYVRAVGQTLALARCNERLATASCSNSPEMKKAMEFLGVVASYLQIYEDSKTADPAEARAARKKAIETLIDSSTDRKARGRDWILSLGSNVGFGSTWTNEVDVRDNHKQDFAVRVPLGLALQYVPRGSDGAGWFCKWWGVHFGLQLADLGQFVRPTDGSDDITWSSFVAPGVEAGLLFGEPNRVFALTGHASYAPSLTDESEPSWRLGIAISYYVPFFDLN